MPKGSGRFRHGLDCGVAADRQQGVVVERPRMNTQGSRKRLKRAGRDLVAALLVLLHLLKADADSGAKIGLAQAS